MSYQTDCTLPDSLLEQIAEQGLGILPELIRIVINRAMQAEREQYLGAAAYERAETRRGHANGYKPKTVTTCVWPVTFDVPQMRQGGFYPEALERGLRTERALLTTLAEMVVQGVSTRKVAAITEQLCGTAISSAQVRRATALLDEELSAWHCGRWGAVRCSRAGDHDSGADRGWSNLREERGETRRGRGETWRKKPQTLPPRLSVPLCGSGSILPLRHDMSTNLLLLRHDPTWVNALTVWVAEQLAMRSIRPLAPPIEFRALPWSAVFRIPTDRGDVYFKACAPSQAFEPALARYLAERRPDDVLPVLAADLARAWLLLPDGGPVLRHTLTGTADDLAAHWSAILPQLAALQRDLAGDATRLLSLGVMDRRPAVLPALFLAMLDRADRWPLGHPNGLSRDDLTRLRAFAARLSSLCEELTALGPAPSLVIDDLHDGHIFVDSAAAQPRYRFFDFGDACVSHPFLQMVAPQRFYAHEYDDLELDAPTVDSLYETYLRAWLLDSTPATMYRALQLALAVGPLMRALTWFNALGPLYPDIEPELMSYYARGMAHWLRELESRCQRLP